MNAYELLLEERYGKSLWWTAPTSADEDSEITTARRRRDTDADFRASERGAA